MVIVDYNLVFVEKTFCRQGYVCLDIPVIYRKSMHVIKND